MYIWQNTKTGEYYIDVDNGTIPLTQGTIGNMFNTYYAETLSDDAQMITQYEMVSNVINYKGSQWRFRHELFPANKFKEDSYHLCK
jgi:hypothetical protein